MDATLAFAPAATENSEDSEVSGSDEAGEVAAAGLAEPETASSDSGPGAPISAPTTIAATTNATPIATTGIDILDEPPPVPAAAPAQTAPPASDFDLLFGSGELPEPDFHSAMTAGVHSTPEHEMDPETAKPAVAVVSSNADLLFDFFAVEPDLSSLLRSSEQSRANGPATPEEAALTRGSVNAGPASAKSLDDESTSIAAGLAARAAPTATQPATGDGFQGEEQIELAARIPLAQDIIELLTPAIREGLLSASGETSTSVERRL